MNRSLVRIVAKSYTALRDLDKFHLDLKKRTARQRGTNKYVVVGIATQQQVEQLRESGYTVKILSDLTSSSKDRIREVSKVNRFREGKALGDVRDATLGGYMNSEEIESALVNLASLHPDYVKLIDLPHKSWEGRASKAVRIHFGPIDSESTGILFTGSMHAREWGGSDITINLIVNLVNSYLTTTSLSYGKKSFSAPKIKKTLEKLDLFIFPDVNPDGKVYSQSHDDPNSDNEQAVWWRKIEIPFQFQMVITPFTPRELTSIVTLIFCGRVV